MYQCSKKLVTCKEHCCFDHSDFPAHSMFTFDVCWGSLGTSIFGNSSSAANNTRSRLPSRLSFCFLWLWRINSLKILSILYFHLIILKAWATQQTVLMKTSWRCLEDVFRLRLQKTSSRRLDQEEYDGLSITSSKRLCQDQYIRIGHASS